jgi:hypothetical protein
MSNSNRKRTNSKNAYEPLNQSDSERTRDEFLEAQESLNQKINQKNKTNLYKSRIIDTEIHSSLIFQTVLYFNFFYSIMSFLLQLFSLSYKLWIFVADIISMTRLIMLFIWIIFEMFRLDLGYKANIRQQVI